MEKVYFIKLINKKFTQFLPIIGLVFLIVIFFIKLFYPYPKIFFTPDVSLSDFIHLNYGLKFLLHQNLAKNQLPWWETRVGNGYPVLAEGQIGVFFLPNLIIFRLFPFSLGFRIIFPLTFFITALGIYFLLKELTKSKLTSFFGSCFFIFSIPYVTQIIHLNLIQAFSFFPWYFLSILKWNEKSKKIWFYLQLFFLSQIFFAGHFQIFFIGFLLLYIYFSLFTSFKETFFLYLRLTLFLIPVIAIQFLPTLEFALNSIRNQGISHYLPNGDLPWQSLLTYINFLSLGNLGQFPNFSINLELFGQFKNLVWETNLYTGIFPLIFTGYFFFKKHHRKTALINFFIIIFLIILSFGTKSPLFFIFFLPIFNFFRTTFRFSFFANFFIILSFSLGLSYFLKNFSTLKKAVIIFFLTIDLLFLFFLSCQLHPVIPEKKITQPAKINKIISEDKIILQSGFEFVWNKIITGYGYKKFDTLIFLIKNNPYPYFNILENTQSADIFLYSLFHPKSIFLRQILLIKELYEPVHNEIERYFLESYPKINLSQLLSITKKEISLEKKGIRLLQLNGVDYLISPFLYTESSFIKKIKTVSLTPLSINIYQIRNRSDKIYLSKNFAFIDSAEDLFSEFKNDIPTSVFFLKKDEKAVRQFFSSPCNSNENKIISFEAVNQTKNKILTQNSCPIILVINDSYYPGWQAMINGKKAPIYRINISQKAILLPRGRNEVFVQYKPWWHYIFYLSLIINLFLFIRLIVGFFSKDFRRSS